MDIHVVGGGMLSKFIIDILESNDIRLGGVFDDHFPNLDHVLGYPVLGKIKDITIENHQYLALGIGEPVHRKRMIEKFSAQGHIFPQLIHKNTTISKHSHISEAAIVGPGSIILAETKVGFGACLLSNVNLNQNVTVGRYALVGAGVCAGNNALLGEGCHISMSQIIAPNAIIDEWEYIDQKGVA